MTNRNILVPRANRPIPIEPSRSTVVVRKGPLQIAKTSGALIPGDEHADACPSRYAARAAARVRACQPSRLLTAGTALSEASCPPVQYIPRADVDMARLERSAHTSYCPCKGEANCYSIPALGETGVNAVRTDEAPFEAVAGIAGHLAFHPDRVSVETGEQP